MKPSLSGAFKSGRASQWTRERLDQLSRQDLVNLQANAARLGEQELATLCDELAKERPKRGPDRGRGADKRGSLLPRSKAFGARGVWLQDPRTSWSGVRKSDGGVVMAIWHDAIVTRDGACACLLWAPNVEGGRPWSDTAAGRERLEHCKIAIGADGAEGLIVHGEALAGSLPEDRARTVLGIDAQTVIRFSVERSGEEYWARWGKKPA
ncbi:MAG TPA: hypothetical protein VFB93_26215 [Burkholderiales bacterium]|jgi:hypothetical protein|nr:hypothetical protein [Burkholderiales bacterium]